MEKYHIVIGHGNKSLSRRVQETLFSLGYKWHGVSGQTALHTKSALLHINWITNGTITQVPYAGFINNERATVLDGEKLANGAYDHKIRINKPVKEMTVAEVSAALGHEVKIVRS